MEPGELIHGSILFYIDGTGKHGMVADPVALTYVYIGPKWAGNYTSTSGNFATDTKIGSGKANIDAIVANYGTSPLFPYAALGGLKLEQNGYKDWFLPSIDEASQLKKNLYDTDQGWARGHFWSSSTPSAGNMWCLSVISATDIPDLFFSSSYASVCEVFNVSRE